MKKKWKFFVYKKDILKINFFSKKKYKFIFYLYNTIPINFFSFSIFLYNGIDFTKFFLLKFFRLFKFGMFLKTRQNYIFIKKKKKIKK